MKACRLMKIMVASIFGLLIAAPNLSFGQDEYDDLYFTPKDRKEVKYEADYNFNVKSVSDYDKQTVAKNTETGDVINPTYSPSVYGDLEEDYSSKNVNPEYIARYKSNPKEASSEEIIAEGDSYYEEDYLRTDISEKGTMKSSTNAYSYPSTFYGACDPRMRSSMYGSSFYDPFMGGGFSPGWNIGLGYSFGYMPGFNMSIGYGSGYNPWYSPFYSGYGGMSRFYNPYYSPWADPMYNSMMYGYGGPGYYNPYGMYDPYSMYNNSMYTGYNTSTVNSGVIAQTVTTSSPDNNGIINPNYRNRVSRGSDVYSRNDNVPNRRTASEERISAQDNESTVNARTANKDYSISQNEYYNSRTASRNGNSTYASNRSSNGSTVNTRNVSGNTVGTSSATSARVRSSRNTSSDYSRPSYRSAKSSKTSYNSLGRSSSSSNSSYYKSRSSSGSSFSSGSGSSYRSSGSSSGSRSSGSSSGGSRSSSSGGGSRSSGRGN